MIINENPIIEKPIRTISQKKFNNKKTHILSLVKNRRNVWFILKIVLFCRNNKFIVKN